MGCVVHKMYLKQCVPDCRKCKNCVKNDHIPLCGEYRLGLVVKS